MEPLIVECVLIPSDHHRRRRQLLRRTIGPQELPIDVVLPITVVYALIFITGVIGNVAVCLVIFRHPALQTATNFYLFSLAAADLTVLVLGKCADV